MAAAAAAAAGPYAAAASQAAATAGVGAAAWGKFAWGYSRSLYFFDAGFRFERMSAGYEFANSCQEMFRNDLEAMTELTFRKMGIYTVVGTMGMAIFIAIFCAGRLGLHGPSPPVWIMGLFLTNIAAAFAYAGLGIWLAFHAMWRCKAACLHLTTRKVRLMIPTRKKLDEARKYGSQWEHQKMRDLLRVPYMSDAIGHKWSGEVPDVSDEEGQDGDGRASSAPPAGGRGKKGKRVPNWIEEEYEQDRVGITGGSGNAGLREDAPPEHFQLYAKAQKEWFSHDCYARICMFYSFLCFYQGGAFYSLGQIAIELRAWWPMFAANMIFTVCHFLMLRFDIVKPDPKSLDKEDQRETLPYCQYAGTACIPIACIGMALDFRVEYWNVAIQFTWACIFICHLLQIVYALRMMELIIPKEVKREERIGNMWWPVGWKVPPAFQHVYYFVAPPPYLRPGQFDVVREMKQGYYAKPDAADGKNGNPEQDMHAHALDDNFKYMMTTAWGGLSARSMEQVKHLHGRFTEIANRKPSTERANELGHIERELIAIQRSEQAGGAKANEGYSSDEGTGSDGSSGYSSGASTGKAGAGARHHADAHSFTKFSYAEPHKLVMIIASTFAFSWVFLTFGMVIDRAVGVQGLVTAPHWARPPMTRSSKYPWERATPLGNDMYMVDHKPTPEELYWHENNAELNRQASATEGMSKSRPNGWAPHWFDDYGDRRLSSSNHPVLADLRQEGMKQAFSSLVSSLPTPAAATELLQRVPTEEEAYALTNLERFRHAAGTGWHPRAFTWPGFFEPKMLACPSSQDGARHALAITPRGVAAIANLGNNEGEAERFVLTGLSDYAPLLAASWSPGPKAGLMLVTKMGDLLHCPGSRQGSRWNCGALTDAPPRVPLAEGSRLTAAATAWIGGASDAKLHAAVILESSPDVVALWALEGNTEAASWLPLGELPVPARMASRATLAFVNEGNLLLATSDGATIQRRISDGSVVTSSPALNLAEAKSPLQWQAACGLHGPDGGIAHLSMRQEQASRRPEVMVMGFAPSP